jgi:translation initiation factor IF-1
MCREAAFEVEGLILEVLPNRTCRVVLSNGHQLVGYVAGKAKWVCTLPAVGAKVRLRLSPCDLSQGRIMLDAGKK